MNKYREYLKNQVRELLTNYGEISIIWFDFSFPGKNGKAVLTGILKSSEAGPQPAARNYC